MEKSHDNSHENSNDEISLKKYFNIFIKEKKLIISLTLITSMIGVATALIKKPVWRGDFKIVVTEKNSIQGLNSNLKNISSIRSISSLSGLRKSNEQKTRLEILKSSSVLRPVYEFAKNNDSNLNLSYKDWINKKTIIKNDNSLKANEFIFFDIAPSDINYNSNVRFQTKYNFIEEIPMMLNQMYDVAKFTTRSQEMKPQKRNDYED